MNGGEREREKGEKRKVVGVNFKKIKIFIYIFKILI
jgi:hypothetical protein